MSDNFEAIKKAFICKNPKHKELAERYVDIEIDEAKKLTHYRHAAHVCIWARNGNKLWSKFDLKAAVLMQMRFDGCIGFPGGFIEGNDLNIEEGLNRELDEEMGLNDPRFAITPSDHFYSSANHADHLVLHFYAKEVSLGDFESIERGVLASADYGAEVMGVLRPPLYETDKGRGFVDFMRNQFVGNSLVQLLRVLDHYKILNSQETLDFINKL